MVAPFPDKPAPTISHTVALELRAALADMIAAAHDRWRSLPTDSFEKRSLNNARAALARADAELAP